uniref:Uncharacterized protein n=1 Tax=Branchiostoma floridae TaxID=7739 RepID=C3YKS4_BRAFL|eukprot:XP_002603131.1 hypothetical protein BRAFLDRAFT_63235 [Branchiostoma floridae]
MIQKSLEMRGAFTCSTFRTISSEPPEITVTDQDDGSSEVKVRLSSMRFTHELHDPRSYEREKLEVAAKAEIIRSFDLPIDKARIIRVYIRKGSVVIFIYLPAAIVYFAATTIRVTAEPLALGAMGVTIYGLNSIDTKGSGVHSRASDGCDYTAKDKAKDIKTMGSAASGAVIGATYGTIAGLPGMALGAAIGFIGGAVFGNKYF